MKDHSEYSNKRIRTEELNFSNEEIYTGSISEEHKTDEEQQNFGNTAALLINVKLSCAPLAMEMCNMLFVNILKIHPFLMKVLCNCNKMWHSWEINRVDILEIQLV